MRRMWRFTLGDERGAIFLSGLVLVTIMTILGVSLFDLSMIEGRLATGDSVSNQVLYCAEAALGRTMNDTAGRMTQIANLLAASTLGTLTWTETVTYPRSGGVTTCSNTVVFKEVAAIPATACMGGWCRYLTATSTGPDGTKRGVRIQLLNLGLWRNWNLGDLNQLHQPFWDGDTSDFGVPVGSVGSWLTNTGAFAGGRGPGVAFPFWGDAYSPGTDSGGAARPDMFFRGTGGTVTFEAEFTAYDGHHGAPFPDRFGWFEYNPATQAIVSTTEIFNTQNYNDPFNPAVPGSQLFLMSNNGVNLVSKPLTFSGTKYYGFYLKNGTNETMYSVSTKQSGVAIPGVQHFALFKQDANTYWMGVEDLNSSPDRDFQDVIFKIVLNNGDVVVDPSDPFLGTKRWKEWQECPPPSYTCS